MSDVNQDDIRHIYDQIDEQRKEFHELSTKLDVFMATQAIKNESIRDLEVSYQELARNSKKINSWILAGGIVVVILAAVGKGAFFVYEHAADIRDFLFHGK